MGVEVRRQMEEKRAEAMGRGRGTVRRKGEEKGKAAYEVKREDRRGGKVKQEYYRLTSSDLDMTSESGRLFDPSDCPLRASRRILRNCCSHLAALVYTLQTPEMFDYLDAVKDIVFSSGLDCVPVTLCRDAYPRDICIQGRNYPPFITQLD